MKERIISNFIWRFFERFGTQGINFVVSIILARKLGPGAYGTIALANVIIVILQVLVEKGFGTALVQKKNTDDLDFSSVFYFNIVSAVVIYFGLFLFAPVMARINKNEALTSIIRALGLILLFSGLKNVQQAYISKNLLFRSFFFASLSGIICGGLVGVFMAIKGYGPWALVAQTLINEGVSTSVLWATVRWRPKKIFSWSRLLTLIRFGWKLLVSALIDTVYNRLRDLIIGVKYTTEDLAFYNKGNQLPSVLVINVCTACDSVLFPTMSNVQDDKDQVKELTRKSIKLSSYIIVPMMVGVAVCARPLIAVLLTENWLPCVPYLRISCITYAFYMIHTANLNAVNAIGRSDIFLKLEIIKKSAGIGLIAISLPFGPYYLALSGLVSMVLCLIVNCYPNKKLLNYGLVEQMKDVFPGIAIALIMGVLVYLVSFLNLPDILVLLIQIPLGVLIYFLLSKLFNLWAFQFLLGLVKKKSNCP